GLRQVRGSADSARAVLHARSLLDVVGVGEALAPGRREGGFDEGRYRWVLEVEPWLDPAQMPGRPADPYAPQLMHLRLQVHWGEGGPRWCLQLESVRRLRPAPSGVAGRGGWSLVSAVPTGACPVRRCEPRSGALP